MTYTKQYVDYQAKGTLSEAKGQCCGNCAYFNGEAKCRQVDGRIDFDYWCVLWKPSH